MTKLTKLIVSLIGLTLSAPAIAVEANNHVFAEALGNGGVYTLNYERTFNQDWGVRIGAGAGNYSLDDNSNAKTTIVTVPLLLNKYWSAEGSAHKLETGLGVVGIYAERNTQFSPFGYNISIKEEGYQVVGTGTIGYRYMPKATGMLFKAGYTPLFTTDRFFSSVGIGLGYTF